MTGSLTSDQIFIRKLTEIVLSKLGNEAFGVKELAWESGMSLHSLNRKLNSINKKTANQFIREVKLQKALEMIKNESLTANEIAYKVGFSSAAYFNLCFSEFFGYPPGKVKKWGLKSSKEDFLYQGFAKQKQKKPIRQVIAFLLPWMLFLCTLIVISVFLVFYIQSRRQSKALGKLEKSIAVLPFLNNSSDRETTYFINGIMEKILNNLQIVKELRVISRTSVEQFRNTTRSIPEIAKKLGVNYIVEGSGQKYGNTFSVSVQLIKASSENHIWGKTFEKEINETKNIFNVQSEIAQSIASALKATITPEEKQLINLIPTTNLTAYDFYQRGNDFWSKMNVSLALDMFSKAIREDSLFAPAYAKRAVVYSYLYRLKNKELDGYKLNAKEDIKKSIMLNPELPEVKLAKVFGDYILNYDYDNALKTLKELETEGPNMAEVHANISYILRRQGKLEESISEAKRSIQMDPFNAGYIANLSDTYQFLHQHNNQIEFLREGLILIPDCRLFNYFIFYALIDKTADLKIALKESGLKEEDVQYLVYYYSRQYDKLRELISTNDSRFNVEYNNEYVQATEQYSYHPKTYNLALIYFLSGNKPLCKIYADSAIIDLKNKIKENPNDERYYATLGKCYALIGNNIKAVDFGKRGVSMMPIKSDALKGVIKEQDLMEIYIFTGNYDQALNKIEYLLSIPSWLSVGKLMIDPIFDNLRSLPRFQKIINSAQKRQSGS
jgi:TolB-like protein/AraC-like DNA-binding protein